MVRKPVALIHGWGGSYDSTYRAAGWASAVTDAGLEPIGIDLPGHGPRGGSQDPADYGDLASDFAAQLPSTVRNCIGFSLGAKLLLELEARSPGRFDRLVIGGVGDNLFAPEASGPAVSAALRGQISLESVPPILKAMVEYSRKSGSNPHSLAAVLERAPNPVLTPDRLTASRAFILIVNSQDDPFAIPDDRLRSALPNAKYVRLTGPDHIGLTDDARFREVAADFVSEGRA
jgi:pimeloyl-ACP methyl ester carboxylesterase